MTFFVGYFKILFYTDPDEMFREIHYVHDVHNSTEVGRGGRVLFMWFVVLFSMFHHFL